MTGDSDGGVSVGNGVRDGCEGVGVGVWVRGRETDKALGKLGKLNLDDAVNENQLFGVWAGSAWRVPESCKDEAYMKNQLFVHWAGPI